jgi:hypothetical protein
MKTHVLLIGSALLVATMADACGQFDWQQGWVVPPRDPRQRRLLKERAVLYAGPAARGFVESSEYGDDAALALSVCSQGVAVQLAAFHASGGLSRLPRKREFLRLIAQPGWQDSAALWAMQHANELADPWCMDLFLVSPAEFVLGMKRLPDHAPEVSRATPERAPEITRANLAPYYSDSSDPAYSGSVSARLAKQESLIVGAGLLVVLGLCAWWKHRRQACDLPA